MEREFKIVQEYKKMMHDGLSLSFPNLNYIEIEDAINYSISKRMQNNEAFIENSFKHKKLNTTIIDICEYILEREPIITPYGVMFKKHGTEPNPIAKLLAGFMSTRKEYKNKMFMYDKGSEQFEKYNLFQLLAKLDANSFYGACGQYSCILFNLHVAATVTTQGRSLVSSAGLQFEMFLNNNVKFSSLDDVVTFIINVKNEKLERHYKDIDILDRNVSVQECVQKLILTCGFDYIPTEEDFNIIHEMVSRLHQEDINRIYYKNNLFEFMENSSMSKAIIYLLKNLEIAYLDPNTKPKEISVELEEFKDIMLEYVYYHHQVIDRMDKYDNMIRSVSAITDTDSTIISLDGWYRFILNKVKDVDLKIKRDLINIIDYLDKDEFGDFTSYTKIMEKTTETLTDYDFFDDEVIQIEKSICPYKVIPQEGLRHSIINILAYCLGEMINDYMIRYTKSSYSYRGDDKCLIIMKNEFLFKRVMITDAKKNYASIQELQEGNFIKGGKLDIKGLALSKSTSNEATQKRLKEILYEDVLNCENIDQVKILKQLAIAEKDIFNSILRGDKDYYKPIRVKSIQVYKNPMSTPGVKQMIAWNALKNEGDEAFDLEEANPLDIIKVDITPKNIDKIKDTYPDIYEKLIVLLQDKYFNTGLNSIGIPINVDIPKWILEFVDYKTIINDNIKLFPVENIGIYRGNDNNNYTNIVSL